MSQQIELHAKAQSSSTFQTPPVDSSTCYCKVDSGLETAAGAGRLVPRSKQGIQPNIKLDAHRSKKSRKEREIIQSSLIPGLLDELAIACLIRVPRIEHRKLHLVCKIWNQLLSENLFCSLRKSHGMAEEWIYVITTNDGRISWHAFDPIYQRWQTLPPVPWEFSEAYAFGCEVLSGCRLYLFGGMISVREPMRSVLVQINGAELQTCCGKLVKYILDLDLD